MNQYPPELDSDLIDDSFDTHSVHCYHVRRQCAYSSGDRAPASGAGCAGSSPARRTIFFPKISMIIYGEIRTLGINSE
jgi:hypothetical protein